MSKINLIGACNRLSYGNVAVNLVQALHELNEEPAFFPINETGADAEPIYHAAIKASIEAAAYYNKDAPCVRVWHQWKLDHFVGKGPRIGFPIFELDKLTKLEEHHVKSCDLVVVPSAWAEKIVRWAGCDNTDIVPLGVDKRLFKPLAGPKPDKTIFLSIGKYEIRKAHDLIPQWFSKAFTQSDNVELWTCNTNPFLSPKDASAWENLYLNSPLGNKIKILSPVESQSQLCELMNQATCGLCVSRAEGWNLPCLEMMACGIPSIVTNYSAHTEFCSNENSYLVEIGGVETAFDGQFFKNNGVVNTGNWARFEKAQEEQCIEFMRSIHRDGVSEEMKSNCLKTARNLSWQNSAEKLLQAISHFETMKGGR